MIFVTTGTTIPFDLLIKTIDQFVGQDIIPDKVICQIGNGNYIPENCEYFKYKESIDDYIEQATIVISHGGTGTVLSLIERRKKFIAVANLLGADNHQTEFLEKINSITQIPWTDNPKNIPQLIKQIENNLQKGISTKSLIPSLIAYIQNL